MSIRVAINGFGRIGRLVARHLKAHQGFDLVAINDLTSSEMLGYLFAHDSVHGHFDGSVEVDGQDLIINGDRMRVYAERDPAKLPWQELGVEYVIESTGLFRSRETAGAHINAGARKVLISAPGKDVAAIESKEDALTRAYNLERTSLLYYQALKEVMQADILDEMIAEERKHITQVMKYLVTGAKFRGLGDKF